MDEPKINPQDNRKILQDMTREVVVLMEELVEMSEKVEKLRTQLTAIYFSANNKLDT